MDPLRLGAFPPAPPPSRGVDLEAGDYGDGSQGETPHLLPPHLDLRSPLEGVISSPRETTRNESLESGWKTGAVNELGGGRGNSPQGGVLQCFGDTQDMTRRLSRLDYHLYLRLVATITIHYLSCQFNQSTVNKHPKDNLLTACIFLK